MKKIIVTGGLGFIGSNLIDLLLKKNFFVINIDKATYSSNYYNVKEFKDSKRYKFIKLDIKNKNLKKILKKNMRMLDAFYQQKMLEWELATMLGLKI